jgi:hypothetical protein
MLPEKESKLLRVLIAPQTMVKMRKPGKKKALTASWEGTYQFMAHADGIGNLDFE